MPSWVEAPGDHPLVAAYPVPGIEVIPGGDGKMVPFSDLSVSGRILNAYNAPFPDDTFKAGARIMPSLVPITTDDPEHKANKKASEQFGNWEKPLLTTFSDSDPVTRGGDRFWQIHVPGAKDQKHTTIENAGHFLQEDKGPEIAKLIIEFIKDNPI